MSDWNGFKTWAADELLTADDVVAYILENTTYLVMKETVEEVKNSTSESDLLNGEFTIPADLMGSHRRAVLAMHGSVYSFTGGGEAMPRFKLKLGGTTLFDLNPSTASLADINSFDGEGVWWTIAEIKQQNSTSAQEATIEGGIADGNDCNFVVGTGYVEDASAAHSRWWAGRNNTTVAMTSDRTLTWTVTNPVADDKYSVKLHEATLAIL